MFVAVDWTGFPTADSSAIDRRFVGIEYPIVASSRFTAAPAVTIDTVVGLAVPVGPAEFPDFAGVTSASAVDVGLFE